MRAVGRHGGLALLVGVAALAVVLYATGAMPDFPDVERIIADVAQALGAWTYALVGTFAFLETGAFVGLVVPGESIVIVGGVIAGQGEIALIVLIGLVWTAAILGDTVSFFIGRRLGRGFVLRHGPRVKIDRARFEHVEAYFRRHGGKTIVIGRFIGLVRALAPFVAGSSGLPYRRFVPFSVIGCGLWATTFSVLGFVFYQSFDQVANVAGQATFGFGVTVAVVVGAVLAYRRLRHPEERRRLVAWMERRPVARELLRAGRGLRRHLLAPIWRIVGPQLRFVWNRVTPGELGLELTTALAVAGVGSYLFAVYAVAFAGGVATTPADRELIDLARELNDQQAVTDVVIFVTDLGAGVTVMALAAGVAVLLALRRNWVELATWVIAVAALALAVDVVKDAIDRPRPGGGLVATGSAAYPSGHAAYSTVWVAAAVVVARVLPGFARGAALLLAAVAVAAAIGLSRIYLQVHYWSDVVGGWGLGAAVFGLCTVVALVVAHVRQNGRRQAVRREEAGAPR